LQNNQLNSHFAAAVTFVQAKNNSSSASCAMRWPGLIEHEGNYLISTLTTLVVVEQKYYFSYVLNWITVFVREHGVHAGPKDYFVVVVVVVVICGSI
jgi:hypothetical protein